MNTDFIVKGDNKTAEELGFNTDLDKAQVITKDEDKVLDAELHTDLLNQSERDKIVKAGDYLESIYKGITDPGVGGKENTIKEKVYGKLFKEKGQKSHHYIKLEEKTIDGNGEIIEKDLNEKANRVQALVDSFAADLKYEGETPRILIGDLPPGVEAFASPENNTIAIDRKVLALADANKVLTLVGHELGHFNSYDANTESTAKRVENAIQGTKNKGKYTEKIEKEFQEKYAGRNISGNEAQKVIDGISEDSRENFALTTTIVIGGVVLIGSYYSGQKTAEYLNSEEGKRAWNKFEENLKEEWETKKNKGIAYAEIYQTSLEAFLTDKIGIKDIVIKNETIHKIQVDVGDVILTPDTNSDIFKKEKNDGSNGYLNKEDGSWWEKDTAGHGGSTWKRWPKKPDNKKKKNDEERRSIGKDGKVLRR